MNSNYYGVVKKVSSLVGQWPYQNPKTKLIYLSFVTLSTFSIVIPQVIDNYNFDKIDYRSMIKCGIFKRWINVYFQLAKFVICDGDMQCIFQTMAAHMLTIITLVKLYTCHLNRYKVRVSRVTTLCASNLLHMQGVCGISNCNSIVECIKLRRNVIYKKIIN